MKEYLKTAIMEQINRGFYLKKLIPHPLKYVELQSLADRCGRMLDQNIEELKFLLRELDKREQNNLRDIYRGFRTCARYIELVECFGISALYHETPELGYLNKLIIKIHKEINFPLTPPSVACISTSYYFFNRITNVVFVPIGEANFLLHLPDLFHELGHEVLYNKEKALRLAKIKECYNRAINIITKHYRDSLQRTMRETGPTDLPRTIAHIHSQWKRWVEEFFCDLFACYTLGPAYAWSHLHLTTKKSDDIYTFSSFLPQKHPSDDSRMKMLIIGLHNLGFQEEAESISSKWENIPLAVNARPVIEYQYAYPEELMKEIADLFLIGLRESNFAVVSPTKLGKLNRNSIVKILNEAWRLFWDSPDAFRNWEKENIDHLKSIL